MNGNPSNPQRKAISPRGVEEKVSLLVEDQKLLGGEGYVRDSTIHDCGDSDVKTTNKHLTIFYISMELCTEEQSHCDESHHSKLEKESHYHLS